MLFLSTRKLIITYLVLILAVCSVAKTELLMPVAVEIRLVGLSKTIEIESLQANLDVLATTDVELFSLLRLGLSYKIRHVDERMATIEWSRAMHSSDELADADEIDTQISLVHDAFTGFVVYVFYSGEQTIIRKAYSSDPVKGGDAACSTQVWVSDKDRFAWIDLSARDPRRSYGQLLQGKGFVAFGRTVPQPGDISRTSFTARLAALCHRAALQLAIPFPLRNRPPIVSSFDEKATVRLILIGAREHMKQTEMIKSRWEKHFLGPLRQVSKEVDIEFETIMVNLEDCPICAAAHELSIRSKEQSELLDPQMMCQVLEKSSFAAVSLNKPQNKKNAVLNVFVFKTASGPLLMEHSKQQTSEIGNCIVGVEGVSSDISIPTHFQCREDGRTVTTDSWDITRQVLASALKVLFAIAPSYETYSTAIGGLREDHLFAVGHTPFGPFSRSTKLSKSIEDSTWRNVLVWHLAETLEALAGIRKEIENLDFGKKRELVKLIDASEGAARRSMGFIGLLDVTHAKEFANEARRLSMEAKIIFDQLQFVEECSSIQDEDAETNSNVSLIPFLLLFMAFAVIYEMRISKVRMFVRDMRPSVARPERKHFQLPAKKVD